MDPIRESGLYSASLLEKISENECSSINNNKCLLPTMMENDGREEVRQKLYVREVN